MKTLCLSLALAFAPIASFAVPCEHGFDQRLIPYCAEGTTWDASSGSCVETPSS